MFNDDMSMYIDLYNGKYATIEKLFEEIIGNEDHTFWDACRDVARDKLKNTRWRDESHKIDNRGLEVTRDMCTRLIIWLEKARNGKGSLSKHLDDQKRTINWLFERWISTFKNSFDKRYKFYIPPMIHISLDENTIGVNNV